MDLLCTENIMNVNENEIVCGKKMQEELQQRKLERVLQYQPAIAQEISAVYVNPSPAQLGKNLSTNIPLEYGYTSVCESTKCVECCQSPSVKCIGSHASATATVTCVTDVCAVPDTTTTVQTVQSGHVTTTSYQEEVYSTNLINRTIDYVNTATEDPTFLTDRCLENALKAEEKRPQSICTYFVTVQEDITPPMRKIVAEWMMEVCAEEKCQEEVVLLALNYMDRFLSTKSVRKTHLQILAAACLLLASKLREPSCRALSADLLVFYTDNSIYKGDLIKWELFVLSRLGWDLSSVTPLDFLELLLIRLPIRSIEFPDLDVDKVRQHAQAFISLAAKEHYFSKYSASTIAASSIAAALSGLNWHGRTGHNLRHLLNLLTDLTSIAQECLLDCMVKMEAIFEEHSRKLQPYMVTVEAQQHSHNINGTTNGNARLPDLTQTCKMQANAQKDIQDIKF